MTKVKWDGEICKKCKREQRLGWAVSDELWFIITDNYSGILCLECFLELAHQLGYIIKIEYFTFLDTNTF